MSLTLPKGVFIDLDGTLVDSVPDLAQAIDQMQSKLGFSPHDPDKVKHWVGNGIEKLVERAVTESMREPVNSELMSKAMPLFMMAYHQSSGKNSRVYKGVFDGLNWLKNNNIKMACITNKDTIFTLPLLTKLGLIEYFDTVICGDSLTTKKPHPAPLLHCAEQFGLSPDKTLMIGDSINDIKAAKAAAVPIVCVSYGYHQGMDIYNAKPDAVIDEFTELESLFI
ncbi:MAG TPA: phosphoglycolate phosphatase [Methylophaga aminisulfidivorans]|uniref:Phosphoglycolate phosphatase n=2 Tax=root TaxID=1 RepID=A0A7C1VXY5_9GAMM|nr:phosphoglycolate phosphatase [Methylophaga aminisulfidivorans]